MKFKLRTFALMLISLLLSCNKKTPVTQSNITIDKKSSTVYSHDNVTIELTPLNPFKIMFVLNAKEYGIINFTNIAELILIEDIDGKMVVPEGTSRFDYNNPKDNVIGIKCDSTYTYYNDTLDITFALENINHNRMDFHLRNDGKKPISIDKTLLKVSP